MLALTPRGAELELHVNLLRHGRRTCYARNPDCLTARSHGCVRRASSFGRGAEDEERDHGVVQRDRGDDEDVEELVVAEDPGEGSGRPVA